MQECLRLVATQYTIYEDTSGLHTIYEDTSGLHDYRFRALMRPEEWQILAARLCAEVGQYTNFKGEVERYQPYDEAGDAYVRLTHDVWKLCNNMQNAIHPRTLNRRGAPSSMYMLPEIDVPDWEKPRGTTRRKSKKPATPKGRAGKPGKTKGPG